MQSYSLRAEALHVEYFKPILMAGAMLAGGLSLNAQAALESYSNAGVDLVYSTVSDVTWTKDANLFKTMYDADHGLIDKIIAVSPAYFQYSIYNQYPVSARDFDTSGFFAGSAPWLGALAFVNYLNDINYAGNNEWHLPRLASGFSGGANGTADGDEFVELYYYELGGRFGDGIPNTATFDNVRPFYYWTGTPFSSYFEGWAFNTNIGAHGPAPGQSQLLGWAVTTGRVAAVPEVDTAAMLLAGLATLGAVVRRRRHAG